MRDNDGEGGTYYPPQLDAAKRRVLDKLRDELLEKLQADLEQEPEPEPIRTPEQEAQWQRLKQRAIWRAMGYPVKFDADLHVVNEYDIPTHERPRGIWTLPEKDADALTRLTRRERKEAMRDATMCLNDGGTEGWINYPYRRMAQIKQHQIWGGKCGAAKRKARKEQRGNHETSI
jgi:hypothetical protein